MKNFMIGQVIWLVPAVSLFAAVAYPAQPGFLSVASVLVWSLTVMLLLAMLVSATTITNARTGEAAAIARLRTWVKTNPERGLARKTFGWIQTLILVVLSAYLGLVVAAPLLLVGTLLVRLGHSAHRDELAKIDAAALAADA